MYTIHIDLNYQEYPEEDCREMWRHIQEVMEEAGFQLRGRRFFINASPNEAIEWAKEAIDNLEPHQDFSNKRVYRFIKEFYGYRIEDVVNILTPAADTNIEVAEVNEEDLQKYSAS